MPKASNRDKILCEGLRVVHERGFAGASVRDIVQAAGVPQGSFTNHFKSKEAFGLEILDLYRDRGREVVRETLRNDALPPLQRLRAYIALNKERLNQDGMRNGCLFGNFTAESGECGEVIRLRVADIFAEMQQSVAYCLDAAVQARELPPETECDDIAAFVVASVQGAILLAKAQRSAAPMERLERILFTKILCRAG